jgi:hypothetical protein
MTDLFDVRSQLEDLLSLDGNQDLQLSKHGIEWLINMWERFCPPELPPPYFYPTTGGNMRAEWLFGEFEITLEINFEKYNCRCFVKDTVTGTIIPDTEVMLNLKNENHWTILFRGICRCQFASLL